MQHFIQIPAVFCMRWFSLIPAANDNAGGDNQRLYAQTKFYM